MICCHDPQARLFRKLTTEAEFMNSNEEKLLRLWSQLRPRIRPQNSLLPVDLSSVLYTYSTCTVHPQSDVLKNPPKFSF
jgi:hypothetical protein